MSRAFVKDDDRALERELGRPESKHPNYVTPSGLRELRRRLTQAEASSDARNAAYLAKRIESAILVEPSSQPRDRVAFGATVTVDEPNAARRAFTIVGEDDADPAHGRISWISPLAEALLGGRVGDRVLWRRPAGDLPLRIVEIAYRDG
ncbi:MAG TPA: GreA/GreB family elongation factor [Candidatus Dormibacteraeota bacterium]|nr:GreA/GreB family elongation factor [Candidatus Dormibacteraeota bacterium]